MIFAANPCQQRSPNQYIAESEEEVQNILNPRLDDLAIVSNEFGRSEWRLRESGDFIVDGIDVLSSNACEYVWVRTPDDDSDFDQAVTSARINALIGADRPVVLPEGEFELDSAIVIGSGNVSIEGAGSGRTILDLTGVSGNAFAGSGTLSDLPALSGSVVAGQTTITFASAHGLSVQDVFIVENTANGSFNTFHNHYHDGEYFEVAEVLSATSVRVTQPSYSAYSGASIETYKLNPVSFRMKGVTIRFRQGLGPNNSGIKISLGRNIQFEDCYLSGSQYTQIFVDRCFDVRVEDCDFFDNQAVDGNNYGLLVANSQHVRVIACSGTVQRHVVTFGGGTAIGAVPCRDLQVIGGDYSSLSEWAVDFHGNCEHYLVDDVNCHTGIGMGGDNGELSGGMFGNNNASGYAIVLGEVVGMNFLIDGCKVKANRNFQLGLMHMLARDYVSRPSVLDIKNIKMDMGTFTQGSGSITIGITVGTLNVPLTSEITVNIEDCSFSTETTAPSDLVAIRYNASGTAGASLKRLRITNCKSKRCGFQIIGDIDEAVISENIITDALRHGIYVVPRATPFHSSAQKWFITKNTITNAQRYGILFEGDETYSDPIIANNAVVNCGQETAGSFTGIRIDGARNVQLAANDVGDTQAVPTQNSIYTTVDVVNLLDTRNRNLGLLINPSLLVVRGGTIGTLRDDPPSGSPVWNYSVLGYEWGTGIAATDVIPYNFRRDRNNLVQWLFQNRIAVGNTSAGMAIQVAGGAIGNSASAILAAWAQDFNTPYRRGKGGVEANSDADALYLAATGAAQTIDFYAGTNTHKAFELDNPSGAAELSLIAYSFDDSAPVRLKIGAVGTGPGGSGRMIYAD